MLCGNTVEHNDRGKGNDTKMYFCVINTGLLHWKWTAGLTGLPAESTVSTVTGLLAAVESTAELVATDKVALVLHILIRKRTGETREVS